MNKKHLLALLCFICAAVAAYADGPFRNHRYDTFKVEPINEQSIVFVGNSITDMHLWSEAWGNDPRVVNRGNSGGLSSEILANVKSYCAGHPAKIFLMIGTNDNPTASTAPTIVSNIERTIQAIQAESPSTEIYIESLLPSANNRSNTGISAVNTAIQEMLKNYADVTYVDIYSKLVGKSDSDGSYSYDRLHITAAGYQIWLAEIEKYMGGLKSVYPANTASLQVSTGLPHSSFGMRGTYMSMMPLTKDDVLFFGDEMVKNAEWSELLRNPNVKNRGTNWGYEKTSANMSITSANIDCTFANVAGVKKEEPKQILLYTGTGELNGTTAINSIVTSYKAIVKKIRGYAPNAKINLVSLMPTRSYNNNARIKQFNSAIQDWAIEQENVEFIDIFSVLATAADQPKDEYFCPYSSPANDNENYIYGDGYIAVANVLARYIEGCNPVTAKEAAAYRDLIKDIVPKETPAVTLTDIKCDGTAPFPLSDEVNAAIEKMSAVTTVIDYTSNQTPADWASIIGSSSTDDENFFSIGILKDGRLGVRYIGLQGTEGWYTRNKVNAGSANQKIVIVQDPENNGLLQLYIDGVQQFSFDNGDLVAYGCVTYNTRPGQSLYLGGLVTQSLTNKFPFVGTINSLRVYDKALTAEQVAELSYDFNEEGEELGPETVTYILDEEHGFLQRNDGTVNSSWNTYWYSNDEPVFELNAGVNNMTWSNGNIQMETGSTTNATYTFKAPSGYLVKDVKFTASAMTATSVKLTFDGDEYTTSSEGQTFEKTDINKAAFAFNLSGKNAVGTLLTDATVTIIRKDLIETETEENAEPEVFTIFSNKGSIPYRIPAIATAQNGNLICVADYRTSKQDIGNGEIDLHVRLSKDNGKTWEPVMKPAVMDGDANFTKGYQLGAFGDPCIVADRESGRVLLMSCSGYKGYFAGSRDWHQGLARWYSDDNGETWNQAPDIIDEEFIYGPMDESKYGPITGMFIGSGKIHQSRYVKVKDYYRLYCAFSSHVAGSSNSQNFVIYSDDFGMTWNFLGGVNSPAVSANGDEPKCEELPNGNLLFSGRIFGQGGRHYNIFQFTDREKAEGKWMSLAISNSGNSGILGNNATNGEIQLVPVVNKATGAKHYLALQSVPWGPGRANVGIQWKALDEGSDYTSPINFAKKWEGQHQVSYASSCYSTMSVQKDHTIAFVYEENGNNGGYDIQYKNYTIECLTDGKYSYDTEYEPVIEMQPITPMTYSPEAGNVEKLDVIEITFNNDIKLTKGAATLAEGITAGFRTHTDNKKLLTVTLNEAITTPGNYTLTFPAGLLKDGDGQTSDAFSVTYRILAEEKPLGAVITTRDEVNERKTYALYNPHFTAYAIYAPQYNETAVWTSGMIGDAGHALSNPAYAEEVSFSDPNTAWMLVNYEGNDYLYNVGAQQFVKVARPTVFVTEPLPITVEEITDGFAFNTNGGSQEYMCAAPQLTEPIAVWTSSDAGSCWQLIENPNVEAEYDACIKLIDPLYDGISAITTDGSRKAGIFTISGQRLEATPSRRLQKGVYIINGVKVVK